MKLSTLLATVAGAVLATASADAALANNAKMYGLNYDRRQAPDWDPTACKTAAQVAADVKAIAQIANSVRLYGIGVSDNCHTNDVLQAAAAEGITVSLGMWTGLTPAAFKAELDRLEVLLKANMIDSNVVGLHVGSEAVYRKDYSAATAIDYLNQVRQLLKKYNKTDLKLTIADTIDSYYSNPAMIDAVDYVSVNVFPFWEKADINAGMGLLLSRMRQLRTQAEKLGKEVVIGETGWASNGADGNVGTPSLANQKQFFQDFHRQATAQDLPYYWFVAFESEWMHQLPANMSNPVEAHFGVMQPDRSLKSSFTNLDLTTHPRVTFQASTGDYLAESVDPTNIWRVTGVTLASDASFTTKIAKLQHQWLFDAAVGRIRSLNSDHCLHADGSAVGTQVTVATCVDGEDKQVWNYNSETKHAEHSGLCLDSSLVLAQCSDSIVTQKWNVTGLTPVTTAPAPSPTQTPVTTQPTDEGTPSPRVTSAAPKTSV